MKKTVLFTAFLLLLCGMAFAQDPGIQDSIIIHSYDVTYGQTSQWVAMDAVSDDSVAFYQMSIKWYGATGAHIAQGCFYFGTLLQWDVTYDTLVLDESYIRLLGFHDTGGDNNPPLITNGLRSHIITLRMVFEPSAPRQVVTLDTTTDTRYGPPITGLSDGRTQITPAFLRGIIDYGAMIGIDDNTSSLPIVVSLNQNYPNPFNPETNIEFALPNAQNVTLQVYNLLGQTVKTLVSGRVEAGYHTARWNGTNENGSQVPSGVYFYKLTADNFTKTSKMILLR